jgi:DNA repair exonuclease SbcCD ATPase subunit
MNVEDNIIINGFVKSEADLDFGSNPDSLRDISAKIDEVLLYLRKELNNKQEIIDSQAIELVRMRRVLDEKEKNVKIIQNKLAECEQKSESNRQLINKLLGDISHYQNDIEWYKRTYEKRSIWGVMKDKLAKVNPPPAKS